MTNSELDQRTVNEWRDLGFFYDYDEVESCWRVIGSREGFMKFVDLLESYVMNPRNGRLSEHEHYGPYSYLKLMTWSQAEITDRYCQLNFIREQTINLDKKRINLLSFRLIHDRPS
jgi:hypothetical protein